MVGLSKSKHISYRIAEYRIVKYKAQGSRLANQQNAVQIIKKGKHKLVP